MTFYQDCQDTAKELLTEFRQGVIIYTPKGSQTGSSWNPDYSAGTPVTVDGVAKTVSGKYVDGTNIMSTDKEVTLPEFGQEPKLDGSLSIDGVDHEIVGVHRIPAAGTVVAWRLFVRA